MALILSLETSATACSVALFEDASKLQSLEIVEPQAHAAKLALLIDEVLRKSGRSIRALDAVALSAGPGSYTGLRIGTSTAKGICFGLGIPLIAVSTLEQLAFRAVPRVEGGLLCPMIDARRMEVYCEVFRRDLSSAMPAQAMEVTPVTFHELLEQQEMFFFGDGSAKCRQVITHANARFLDGILPDASAVGEMAFRKFERGQFENLVEFTPFYAKDFIARKPQSVF